MREILFITSPRGSITSVDVESGLTSVDAGCISCRYFPDAGQICPQTGLPMDAENIRELELGGCAMHSWALGLSEKHGGLGGFEWEGNPNSHGDLYDQICAMLWNAYDRGEGDYAILFDGQDISEVAYSDFFS